jgi:hypothetical protein
MTAQAIKHAHQKFEALEARMKLLVDGYPYMDDSTKKRIVMFIMAHSLDLKKELDKLYTF